MGCRLMVAQRYDDVHTKAQGQQSRDKGAATEAVFRRESLGSGTEIPGEADHKRDMITMINKAYLAKDGIAAARPFNRLRFVRP